MGMSKSVAAGVFVLALSASVFAQEEDEGRNLPVAGKVAAAIPKDAGETLAPRPLPLDRIAKGDRAMLAQLEGSIERRVLSEEEIETLRERRIAEIDGRGFKNSTAAGRSALRPGRSNEPDNGPAPSISRRTAVKGAEEEEGESWVWWLVALVATAGGIALARSKS